MSKGKLIDHKGHLGAEISLQPDGHILINRGNGIRVYYPRDASRERVYRILDTCSQLFNGWYIYYYVQ